MIDDKHKLLATFKVKIILNYHPKLQISHVTAFDSVSAISKNTILFRQSISVSMYCQGSLEKIGTTVSLI